jgi:hypothetical protein
LLHRIGKVLRAQIDYITHESVPTRWVDLIHYLDERERNRAERLNKRGAIRGETDETRHDNSMSELTILHERVTHFERERHHGYRKPRAGRPAELANCLAVCQSVPFVSSSDGGGIDQIARAEWGAPASAPAPSGRPHMADKLEAGGPG